MTPPFLQRLYLRDDVVLPNEFPTNLPFVQPTMTSLANGR